MRSDIDDVTADALAALRGPGSFGHVIEFHPSIGSTNDRARVLGLAGAREGSVVVADVQTAGRGRLGRRWDAPPGTCLLLSVVLRPEPERLCWIAPLAALAVLEVLDALAPGGGSCKWPNDVLLGGRKTCGILVESVFSGADLRAAVLGIGLNVNLDPASLAGVAEMPTSLAAYTGQRYPRLAVLDALLTALEREIERLHAGISPVPRWSQRLETIGRRASIRSAGEVLVGVAEGVDASGALVLRLDDGSIRTLLSGEVTLAGSAVEG